MFSFEEWTSMTNTEVEILAFAYYAQKNTSKTTLPKHNVIHAL